MGAYVSQRVRNLLLASLVLLTALPGVAAAQFIELEGRVWVPEISARAKIEGGSSAGTRVVSDLDLHYARLGWIWQPWLIPEVLRLGPILEAKAFVAEMTLKAPSLVPRLQETEKVSVVIPTVGLAVDFRLFPVVDLFAEASGLTVGHPGHVVDAEAGARLSLFRFLAITGGYRFFEVRGEDNRSFARLRLSGPFLGASIRF